MARTAAEGTRARILEVAAHLFYAKGVRAVGMSQVIDAAGCGKNLLYTNFTSKNDLVAAYLTAERDLREHQAQRAIEAAGNDPADQIVALTQYIAECASESGFRGCAMRNYLAELPDEDTAPTKVAHDYLLHAQTRIERLVDATGVSRPGEIAAQVWLIHDGLYAMAARPWMRSTPTVAVDLVRDVLTSASGPTRA